MTNTNTIPQRLTLIGSYENSTGRWYVTEDRAWKVRLNDDNEATVIRDGREVYLLMGATSRQDGEVLVANARTRRALSSSVPTYQDVVALVAQARRAESR